MDKNRDFEIVTPSELNKYSIKEEDIILPKRSTNHAAGYDFISPVECFIKPHESCLIPTGVKAYMLENEFLGIYIRSSLAIKHHVSLTNQVGIIDSDYYSNIDNDGHILISLKNESNSVFVVKKGDKIAQGIFQSFLTTDSDSVDNFRTGGIGSTGK